MDVTSRLANALAVAFPLLGHKPDPTTRAVLTLEEVQQEAVGVADAQPMLREQPPMHAVDLMERMYLQAIAPAAACHLRQRQRDRIIHLALTRWKSIALQLVLTVAAGPVIGNVGATRQDSMSMNRPTVTTSGRGQKIARLHIPILADICPVMFSAATGSIIAQRSMTMGHRAPMAA